MNKSVLVFTRVCYHIITTTQHMDQVCKSHCVYNGSSGKTVTPAVFQMSPGSLHTRAWLRHYIVPYMTTVTAAFGIEPLSPRVFREVRLNRSSNQDKYNDHVAVILTDTVRVARQQRLKSCTRKYLSDVCP